MLKLVLEVSIYMQQTSSVDIFRCVYLKQVKGYPFPTGPKVFYMFNMNLIDQSLHQLSVTKRFIYNELSHDVVSGSEFK